MMKSKRSKLIELQGQKKFISMSEYREDEPYIGSILKGLLSEKIKLKSKAMYPYEKIKVVFNEYKISHKRGWANKDILQFIKWNF